MISMRRLRGGASRSSKSSGTSRRRARGARAVEVLTARAYTARARALPALQTNVRAVRGACVRRDAC